MSPDLVLRATVRRMNLGGDSKVIGRITPAGRGRGRLVQDRRGVRFAVGFATPRFDDVVPVELTSRHNDE